MARPMNVSTPCRLRLIQIAEQIVGGNVQLVLLWTFGAAASLLISIEKWLYPNGVLSRQLGYSRVSNR